MLSRKTSRLLVLPIIICMFLSACSASAIETEMFFNDIPVNLTDIEVIDLMPEIVFLLIANADFRPTHGNIMNGIFIDNKGAIKEFSIDKGYEIFRSNRDDINFVKNMIIDEYDIFLELGEDTGRFVDIEELEEYYKSLLNIDNKSGILITHKITDDDEGFVSYYGIRRDPCGQSEIILIKGRGDGLYDHTDPLSDEICEWLVEVIPFESYHWKHHSQRFLQPPFGQSPEIYIP